MVDGKYEKVEMDPKEDILITNGISDAIVAKLKRRAPGFECDF